MKRKLFLAAIIATLAGAAPAYAGNCQIDGTMLLWTGNIRNEGTKTLKEYRCLVGDHTYWIVEN